MTLLVGGTYYNIAFVVVLGHSSSLIQVSKSFLRLLALPLLKGLAGDTAMSLQMYGTAMPIQTSTIVLYSNGRYSVTIVATKLIH